LKAAKYSGKRRFYRDWSSPGEKNTLPIEQMERHDQTPELLVLFTSDFIFCMVSKLGKSTKAKEVNNFRVNRGQAILSNKSCWH